MFACTQTQQCGAWLDECCVFNSILQEEDIYQVPAMDVDGLYSQLNHIKTVSLPRNSVRYYSVYHWVTFQEEKKTFC